MIIQKKKTLEVVYQQGSPHGDRGRNRTYDQLIKSQLLYQLSYAAIKKARQYSFVPTTGKTNSLEDSAFWNPLI